MSPPHPACKVARVVEARPRSSIASQTGECSPLFSRLSFPGNLSDCFVHASCQRIPSLHEVRSVGDRGIARSTAGTIQATSFPWECFHPCPNGCHETCFAAVCFSPNLARRRRTGPVRSEERRVGKECRS